MRKAEFLRKNATALQVLLVEHSPDDMRLTHEAFREGHPAARGNRVAESILLKHAESTESILQALRARGVPLAVGDFGNAQ